MLYCSQDDVPEWRTYNLATGEVCDGGACTTIGVVECVKTGAAPLPKDAKGNVGCGNTGETGPLRAERKLVFGKRTSLFWSGCFCGTRCRSRSWQPKGWRWGCVGLLSE